MSAETGAWVVFPTGNTAAANKTLRKWHELGYRSAVLIDKDQPLPEAHRVLQCGGEYRGFAWAANLLCQVCVRDTNTDVVVVANDDIDPDPRYIAETIRLSFHMHFKGTLGVMQPMGDAYGALDPQTACKAAVSPWIGREFIQRAYFGSGPYCPDYRHLWTDAELWSVAEANGLLWPCSDVSQFHHHWSRGATDTLPAAKRAEISAAAAKDRDLYFHRLALGFPGSAIAH